MLRGCALVLLLGGCAGAPSSSSGAAPTPPSSATRSSASSASAAEQPRPRGPYLGETAGDTPAIFGRGVVSRRYQELNAAFSPAGDELFFTFADPARTHYTLLHMVRGAGGVWDGPVVAPFSGLHADADPVFSGDGQRLYFISKRPSDAGSPAKDFDIWSVDKTQAGWGEPVNLGPPINTPEDEYYVSVTRTGAIYWSRKGDIYRAVPAGGSYKVEPLGPAVNGKTANGKTEEFDPFVAPDESYLIFASFGRPDSLGSADLYVSFRVDGKWQPARWLGPSVNSKAFEYCPIVSPDGRHFFFTSYRKPEAGVPERPVTVEQLFESFDQIENGMGNIYWMKSDFLEAMRRDGASR